MYKYGLCKGGLAYIHYQSVSARQPRRNDTPVPISILRAQISISTYHSPLKIIRVPGEMAVSGAEAGKIQDELGAS